MEHADPTSASPAPALPPSCCGSPRVWQLWSVLPNVNLRRSVDAEFVACVGYRDQRLVDIAARLETHRALLEGFTDQFGEHVQPSALIVRSDAPPQVRTPEAVVAFRNCIALPWVARSIASGGAWLHPRFSDVFDLYPIVTTDDGSYRHFSPALKGYGHFIGFQGQCSAFLPRPRKLDPAEDGEYLHSLLRQWRRRFVQQRKTWRTRALFRSMELAYQAAGSPIKNDSTLYDCGVLVSLWVSAFECLVHPGGKRGVEFGDVIRLLEGVTYGHDTCLESVPSDVRRLLARRYLLGRKGKKRTKGTATRLLPRLYEQLYWSRNSFLHGNPVTLAQLHAFGRGDRPIMLDLAPLMYRFTVLALFPLPDRELGRFRKDINQQFCNEFALKALLRATGRGE